MDSITQAVLGAAIGETMLGKRLGSKAAVAGALIATIPDLDVILHLLYDKFEMLSIHRGFSHSILFSIIAAILIVYILKRFKWTESLKYAELLVFAWLALITHMLLDAFTAYGTMLFYPFSDQRISWDSINVIDPVYTVPMIGGLILSNAIFKNDYRRSKVIFISLLISTLYLFGTLLIKQKVKNDFHIELQAQSIEYDKLTTIPVGIASLNWYGVARSADSIYMHKYSFLHTIQPSFESFPINEQLLKEIPILYADKMRWFAKGNYVVAKHGGKIRVYNLQVDMRGVVNDGDRKFPTVGFFELEQLPGGEVLFRGGS